MRKCGQYADDMSFEGIGVVAHLSILELEDKLGFGALNVLADELRSYPALCSVGLPCSGADIVG